MRVSLRKPDVFGAMRCFLVSAPLAHLLYVPHAHANVMTDQTVRPGFLLTAALTLIGETLLVTWIFRHRGFKRLYFGVALFVLNFMSWALFFNVYRSFVKNLYVVEICVVMLEGVAIYYLSRLPLLRSHSKKPVGILGAAGSGALGNLFSWGLGTLILVLVVHVDRM
jgi:hypothetical protein